MFGFLPARKLPIKELRPSAFSKKVLESSSPVPSRPLLPRPPMATALPATAASCLLQLSRRRLPGTFPLLSPLRAATFRCHGDSSVACSCSPGPGPPPAVPSERRGGGAGEATSPEGTVRIVAVVGEATISPIKDTPWEEVMRHTVGSISEPISQQYPLQTCAVVRVNLEITGYLNIFCSCCDFNITMLSILQVFIIQQL
jgi:hypothetical protein